MPEPEPAAVDATRRTRLASERTYLAWLRGGLAAIAVGIGAGAVVPDVTEVTRWPFVVIGVGFVLMGVLMIGYGLRRHRALERALERGGYAPLDARAAAALAALGVALGLMTILVLLLEA